MNKPFNKCIDRDIIIMIKTILFKLNILSEYRFFLFGSRVDGTCREKSDYDIGVIGKNKLDSEIKLDLEEEFENIPVLIDFIDFTQVDENFKKIAMKNVLWLTKEI
ncbi:MAG: nucleotidyltransferase domain-containing protein [Candidatus Gracilibacteria bacterium]|nr:nucleotidyltransferase domain-containing protein [Candidatus Gracilibacteria bacterium]